VIALNQTLVDRRQVLASATAVLAQGVLSASAHAEDETIQAMVTGFVQARTADALSLAILRDGRTAFYNAGIASRKTGAPATQDTVYEIGSITKTFASLLLAHAIVEGRAAIDDKVVRFLPRGFDNLSRPGGVVTLRDLVTTTSALPNNPPEIDRLIAGGFTHDTALKIARFSESYSDRQFLADLREAKLVAAPGQKPRHSNVAAQLVGVIVERIFHAPFASLVARYIERPFGMAPGSPIEATRSRAAVGYDADGQTMPILTARADLFSGGLRYSASDMARYLARQNAEAEPAIRLTHRPAWRAPDGTAIGFNWIISRDANGETRFRHTGSTLGFSSFAEFCPRRGYAIAALANQLGRESTLGELAAAVARDRT
jgi:CubicO group peptidase (beta-lactamase class C family)